ncbi:hypothetical protein SAMN05421504_108162 [Amycolatopsis xylanica]|uniref:Uncharacterized protein n=1 Tax=Amycolatopsis xylanica TaxID=589385 RepID=A0A1H3PDK3_9PSEU|nr:hypothetical protein [Amycolatopsis xylanica]SDY99160.1 hypothetical protein SAMN05421504_108162 [Amycolatopsis xylanica]
MDLAPEYRPGFLAEPEPAPRDPLAVAIGNASLLGVGYLLLKRRGLAVLTWLITLTLVIMLASVREVWVEITALVWWLLSIVHGWSLATKHGSRVGWQRRVALLVTVPVLLAAGLLRFGAATIEDTVTEARESGDCAPALAAIDRLWLGHRIADGPLTLRGERTAEACHRLSNAAGLLATGLSGEPVALQAGFESLSAVLKDLPGHEKMVGKTLDGFLAGLPAKNPCESAKVTDWLRARPFSNNDLDRSVEAIGRTEPVTLVGCGDQLVAAGSLEPARARYQQYLDHYRGRDRDLTAKAEEGARKATLAIELANVRDLLAGAYGTSEPSYCKKPAQYSGAPSYAKGPNRTLMYGDTAYTGNLPAEWRASGPEDAALIVCVGKAEYGTPVRTCPYTSQGSIRGFPTNVTFKKIVIPIRAYELRTGKLVADTRPEIGGTSCPQTIHYSRYGLSVDIGPPSEMYVTPADADIRAAFAAVVSP